MGKFAFDTIHAIMRETHSYSRKYPNKHSRLQFYTSIMKINSPGLWLRLLEAIASIYREQTIVEENDKFQLNK